MGLESRDAGVCLILQSTDILASKPPIFLYSLHSSFREDFGFTH
jgi:hypothetical protein